MVGIKMKDDGPPFELLSSKDYGTSVPRRQFGGDFEPIDSAKIYENKWGPCKMEHFVGNKSAGEKTIGEAVEKSLFKK